MINLGKSLSLALIHREETVGSLAGKLHRPGSFVSKLKHLKPGQAVSSLTIDLLADALEYPVSEFIKLGEN